MALSAITSAASTVASASAAVVSVAAAAPIAAAGSSSSRRGRLSLRFLLLVAAFVIVFVGVVVPAVTADDDEISPSDYVSMGIDVPAAVARHSKFPQPAISGTHSRFAYVMIHYEGTPKDDLYVLGTQVVIKSIKDSGTKQDVVILCADNVRPSTHEAFRSVGAIIKEVPNIPNPYKATQQARRTYKSRFEFTFNKLYVWNLVEYERVMYLDADNLVVRNMDELFLCGRYCNTFMNPLFFHTGMMVVAPDHKMFQSLVESLLSLKIFSYDGADQGFLTAAFPAVDKAPLFNATAMVLAGGHPSEAPLMRFPMEYNFNSVFWYPFFSFDYYRRARLPFSASTEGLPVSSIDYCIGPLFKPWNWFPHIFFHTVRPWLAVRATVPEPFSPVLPHNVLLLAAIYLVGLITAVTLRRLRSCDAIRAAARAAAATVGVRRLASGLAFLSVVAAAVTAAAQIPLHVVPGIAWPLFAAYFIVIPYSVLTVFVALIAPTRDALAAASVSGLGGYLEAGAEGKDLSSAVSASAAATGASAGVNAGARMAEELPPFGDNILQVIDVIMRLDFFTVRLSPAHLAAAAAAAAAASGGGVAGTDDDDDDDDDDGLDAPLPGGLLGSAGAGGAEDSEYALVSQAAAAANARTGAGDDGEAEESDWTDGGVPLVPLGASAAAAAAAGGGVAAPGHGHGAGGAGSRSIVGRAGARAGAAKAGSAVGAFGVGGSEAMGTGAAAMVAAAQLRSGVTVGVMLPVVLCVAFSFFTLAGIDVIHFHFVEKLVWFVIAGWLSLWSVMHVFRRIAEVAFQVPGALGTIYL